MGCIEKIYSVSALIGDGKCNANCSHCAGKYLRTEANKINDDLYHKNLETAIKLSARYGGWSLSFTSSGEPTCDPLSIERALRTYSKCAKQGAYFPNVNLFTNGILLGNSYFANKYLPKWRNIGLNNIVVSLYSPNAEEQAEAYGVVKYPEYEIIINNIKKHSLGVRCTLLLKKGYIDNSKKYKNAIISLINTGFKNITSWPIGNPDGTYNLHTPNRINLWSIILWLRLNAKMCHGHAWGGGVFDYKGNILRYTDYVTRHNRRKNFVRQLVVFQDGTIAYSWIRKGALCMR